MEHFNRQSRPSLQRSHTTGQPDTRPPSGGVPTDNTSSLSKSNASSMQQPQQQHHHHHYHPHLHRRDRDSPRSSHIFQPSHKLEDAPGLHRRVSKSAGGTPAESRSHSRVPSIAGLHERVIATGSSGRGSLEVPRQTTVAIDRGPAKRGGGESREKAQLRDEEISDALTALMASSTSISRSLDMSYYSILERVSSLHSTTSALIDLSTHISNLHEDFSSDARALSIDVNSQLTALDTFGNQKAKVSSLESRLQQGRSKVEALSQRLEIVRGRAEVWERREEEWHAQMSRRLRVLWGMLVGVLAVVVVLLFIHYKPAGPPLHYKETARLLSNITGNASDTAEGWKGALLGARKKEEQVGMKKKPSTAVRAVTVLPEDPRLRLFDEL